MVTLAIEASFKDAIERKIYTDALYFAVLAQEVGFYLMRSNLKLTIRAAIGAHSPYG